MRHSGEATCLETSRTWETCPPTGTIREELSELNPHTTGVPHAKGVHAYAVPGCAGCLRITEALTWYYWTWSPNLRRMISVALFVDFDDPISEILLHSAFGSVEEVA